MNLLEIDFKEVEIRMMAIMTTSNAALSSMYVNGIIDLDTLVKEIKRRNKMNEKVNSEDWPHPIYYQKQRSYRWWFYSLMIGLAIIQILLELFVY